MKTGSKLFAGSPMLAALLSAAVIAGLLFSWKYVHVASLTGLSALAAALCTGVIVVLWRRRTAADGAGKKPAGSGRTAGLSSDAIDDLVAAFRMLAREVEELRAEIRTTTTRDFLTGALNRSKIEQVLRGEIDRALRYGTPLSLILFDLDNFKSVNDTYGHLSGDYVLRTVIRIVQENIRTTDALGRWGGEEFMLVAPETDREQAAALAEKIRQQVRHFAYQGVGTISISCGLAEFDPGDTIDSLIKRADDAMYRAKRNGRDRVESAERCLLF